MDGQCIGAEATTAVGVTSSLNCLVMGNAMGFCIPISQSVGAKEPEELSRYFWDGLYLCLGVSPFVLLIMMNTPDTLLDMAARFAGQITATQYNCFSGAGDSQRPFCFLVISSCANIVLEQALIHLIPMAGAAIATIISQGISVLLCIWWLMKKTGAIHQILGRSAAGLLAVRFSSFFLICLSAPAAWLLALLRGPGVLQTGSATRSQMPLKWW